MFKTIRLGMKIDEDIKKGIFLMLFFLVLIFCLFFVINVYNREYYNILGIAEVISFSFTTIIMICITLLEAKSVIFKYFCQIAKNENHKRLIDKIYALKQERGEKERIDEYRYLTKEQFKLIRDFVYDDLLKSEKQEKEKADNKKKEISNLENEIKNYKIIL